MPSPKVPRSRPVPKPSPLRPEPVRQISYYDFIVGPHYCNLDVTHAIAAIASASEGDPIDFGDGPSGGNGIYQTIFACSRDDLPRRPLRSVMVSAGGRSGKTSRLLATKCLHAAMTVPLRLPDSEPDPRYPLAQQIAKGEHPFAYIVSNTLKNGKKALRMVVGLVEASPVLSKALVGKPGTESFTLRRQDGILVDICVVAADAGGSNVRAGTAVFCGLDEANFIGEDDDAVNPRDIFNAAIQRVVPYGQIWVVSTPWIEEQGLIEETIKIETIKDGPRGPKQQDDGTVVPGERMHKNTLVAARVSTRLMNPTWDTDHTIEQDMRARDPQNADREIHAIPLTAGTEVFFNKADIKRMFDWHEMGLEAWPKAEGKRRVGIGFDGGLVNDCSAGAATETIRLPGKDAYGRPVDAYETFDAFEERPVRGKPPLKPSEVFGHAADFTLRCGAKAMAADGHYRESVREHASAKGVRYVEAPDKETLYLDARKAMAEGRWRVSPSMPSEVRERLREQLRSITKRPRKRGKHDGIEISEPRMKASPTGASGGHADIARAAVTSLWEAGAGRPVRQEGGTPVSAASVEDGWGPRFV